jgi:hypothetical protein
MVSINRKELGVYFLNHKDYLLKYIKDEFDLANIFAKLHIYQMLLDAFRVMMKYGKKL